MSGHLLLVTGAGSTMALLVSAAGDTAATGGESAVDPLWPLPTVR